MATKKRRRILPVNNALKYDFRRHPRLRDMEMVAIHGMMRLHRGNKTRVAKELGISLKTLYNKLNKEELGRGAS